MKSILITSLLATQVHGQGVGKETPEIKPKIQIWVCDATGCKPEDLGIVLDANWRWIHNPDMVNCYKGNAWNATICPDGITCAKNCLLDGADYGKTYGITTTKSELKLDFVTGTNVGSRVYLTKGKSYYMFQALNKEITFDVDVSKLPCGLNGAVYFVEMDEDGGMKASEGRNTAGAEYGTGYCDAQCPKDIKFIMGEANVVGWNSTGTDTGKGSLCSCCSEFDIVEANSISNAYTSHPCKTKGLLKSNKDTVCGKDGPCDKPGCDLNPYRMGVKDFYGPGTKFTINTEQPFTVSTQFITDDQKDTGELVEVKRFYLQNGKKHEFPSFKIGAGKKGNSITEEVCKATKIFFQDKDDHTSKGGLKQMGTAMGNGMVLTFSIWSDAEANCLWLDSIYPKDADSKKPGAARGTCPADSGDPATLVKESPKAFVKFSNIRFGAIGSTMKGSGDSSSSSDTTPSSTTGSSLPGTVSPATEGSGTQTATENSVTPESLSTENPASSPQTVSPSTVGPETPPPKCTMKRRL